jgi:hypothetical protein
MALADSYTTVASSPATQNLGASMGNREDLRDVLTILEPEATPVTSTIKKGPGPKATLVEVLVDELSDPVIASVEEGKDYSRYTTTLVPDPVNFEDKSAARGRMTNSIHISSRSYGVTDVQSLTDTAGTQGAGEFAFGKAKSVREIKRDIEAVICGGQDKDSSGPGFQTRGLFNWIKSDGPADVHAKYRTPAASIYDGSSGSPAIGALTESGFADVLQSMFEVRSEKKTYMGVLSPNIVSIVDNFTRTDASASKQRYNVNDNASSKTINMEVKVFNTSFGTVNVVPSTFLNVTASPYAYDDDAGLILDMSLLEMQFMDPIHSVELEDQGGGRRGYTKAIYSLCCKNPRGFGKIVVGD